MLKSWEFRESRAKVAGHIYASLGNAYLHRVNGSRAENIELAIEAFQAALENLTREALPLEWAETQDNLGIAYVFRINGNRAQNIELATCIVPLQLYERMTDLWGRLLGFFALTAVLWALGVTAILGYPFTDDPISDDFIRMMAVGG